MVPAGEGRYPAKSSHRDLSGDIVLGHITRRYAYWIPLAPVTLVDIESPLIMPPQCRQHG